MSETLQPKEHCPRCGAESLSPYIPFCSRKCAYADLGHWFKETYKIPVPLQENESLFPEEPLPEEESEP